MARRPALEALDAAMLNPAQQPTLYHYRSSITGQYVTEDYARVNPDTTQREAADG